MPKRDEAAIVARRNKSIAEQVDEIKNNRELGMRRAYHSSVLAELERRNKYKTSVHVHSSDDED